MVTRVFNHHRKGDVALNHTASCLIMYEGIILTGNPSLFRVNTVISITLSCQSVFTTLLMNARRICMCFALRSSYDVYSCEPKQISLHFSIVFLQMMRWSPSGRNFVPKTSSFMIAGDLMFELVSTI